MLGFDLAETRAGQDILKEGIEKGMEKGIEKGRQEGLEEGRREGMEKGRREGLIEAIKLGMQLKFGAEGSNLLSRIEKEKDITRLDRIKEAIKAVPTVKEIEKLLAN